MNLENVITNFGRVRHLFEKGKINKPSKVLNIDELGFYIRAISLGHLSLL